MKIIDAVFQAIIQGLTEFLPVSSSGHLSLYQHFTENYGDGALTFSAILHLGTLVAVFIAFHDTIWALIKEFFALVKDIFTGKFNWKERNSERNMIFMLIISCAVLIPVYFFKDFFEGFAEDSSIMAEGVCFMYTAIILMLSDMCKKGNKKAGDITVNDALTVGFFQAVALLPGVSRSGSTISSGLFTGFSRETAVRYSFILGIPAIFAGCILEVKDAAATGLTFEPAPYIIGFVVAAIVGVCAIKMVNWLVKSDKFKIFAYYTAILGVVVIIISIIEKIIGHPITF